MKKTALLIVLALGMIIPANAQKGKVTSALSYIEDGDLEKAGPALMEAKDHKRSKDWPKTYYVLGRLYQKVYEMQSDMYENPLDNAWENYQKAMEMDDRGRIIRSVELQLPVLQNNFLGQGGQFFNDQKYNKAGEAFETAIEIGQSEVFGEGEDTSLIYNAGLSYYNGRNWDKTYELLGKANEMGYNDGLTSIMLHDAYVKGGNEEKAKDVIIEAFERYPDNSNVMNALLQFMLDREMYSDAFKYIQVAKDKHPENNIYWYAEGLVYQREYEASGSTDKELLNKAIESYKESIRLEPGFFNVQYNMGAILFNEGVEMHADANEITDQEEYNKAIQKVNMQFGKALPYLEKAHELMPEDINTMQTLKTLYYRLQMMDKMEEIEKKLEGGN